MRRILTGLLLFLMLSCGYGQFNVITYNIRYDTPNDGAHAWPHRKADVINLLKFHKADIFCLQEALQHQVEQIDSAFTDFDYCGVGRDDGVTAGEYAPVYYNTNRFERVANDYFWLAENPSKPALGWDAACIRICTEVLLKEKESGKVFVVMNTHFDHIGEAARSKSAALILDRITKNHKGRPVILCGDFNLPPDSPPIQKLSGQLRDSYYASELPPHASVSTWAGFTYKDKPGERIDYIFVSDDFTVLRYAGLTDARDGHYFSDHLPVFIECSLK